MHWPSALLLPVLAAAPSLPTVDLGYNIQQATSVNQQTDTYLFSDIRYAAPPTGQNRFRGPQTPVTDRSSVKTGGQQVACAQSGGTDSHVSEDCLFLDVVVPRRVFNQTGQGNSVPVVVWFFGGGFVSGRKTDEAPYGLFGRDTALNGNNAGFVWVAVNYRLGAFGFLGGKTLTTNGTGDANAGLLDQRFALQWVQSNIAKFGGDPNRVTLLGESSGGGSVMYQITAYGGGNGPPQFQNAIIQSPGFQPYDDPNQTENTFQQFLQLLNVQNVDQARQLSFDAIQQASSYQIGHAPKGSFTYGPTVDGKFVPDLPGKLLNSGRFYQSVKVMVGHNANEGQDFTNTSVTDDAGFRNVVQSLLPPYVATSSNIDYIQNVMYPPVFDGSQAQNYTTQFQRADAFVSEYIFVCNTFYLDKAFKNQTYTYFFAAPPATHGSDLPYTFYPGDPNPNNAQISLAVMMQTYFVNFWRTSNPNGATVPTFNQYGPNAIARLFNVTGSATVKDPAANTRCNTHQTAE